MDRIHKIKCWPCYFQMMVDGEKPFELRVNDRDYRKGDTVILREYDPDDKTYSGRTFEFIISIVLESPRWLREGVCAIGVTRPKEEVGDVMKEFDKEFEFAYTTSRCTVFRKTKLYEYIKSFIRKHCSQPIRLPGISEELFKLELETKEGECFTLGHAIGEHCVAQVVDFLTDVVGLNKKGE